MAANRIQLQKALHQSYDRVLFAKEVLSPVFGSGFTLSSALIPAPVSPNKSESAVIGCSFLVIPIIHVLFWLITYLTYMISGSRTSILGLDVANAIAVAGFSVTGAMLIIASFKK